MRMSTAVAVHIIKVSNIGPVIATRPCLTGCDAFADPCTNDSVPIPASLENAPLLTPTIITPMMLPLATADPVKASEIIKDNDGKKSSIFRAIQINTAPK